MSTNLKRAILKAQKYLEAGDPVEAVSALEFAYKLARGNNRKLIYKASQEADIGSPEKAETLLGMIQ